ncbi:MAG: class I tRNA ligase family protein [Patescibacteria group bacterium]|nr:class I tRNA ligase family protein [Patescibacteria group bacterium]
MKLNFLKTEKKVLKFWKDNNIFEKSIKQRVKARDFIFYEGPPTANAPPGLHHVLARAFKDIVCRYKTMRGFRVIRKGGWDTHGLPVELQIEKKLDLKSKKDIENYGISKFNKKCKTSVWNFTKAWVDLTEKMGYWIDINNPYITYNPEYVESVWWILKQIWNKGLLKQDFKVVPYCPRCGTPLSSHEVADGYKKIKEPSVFVKFKIISPNFKNTSLLVWTTTPWTLPGNVAVALNPKFTYSKIKVNNEFLILAKERIKKLGIEGEITGNFKGKELLNLRYQALYPAEDEVLRNAYKIIGGNFVTLDEGTGLVHIAPAYGVDDMEVAKKNKLPVLLNIDEEGKFRLNVEKWARMYFKDADPLIIKDLEGRGLLFKQEVYEHDYPFCWRCKNPLLYYAKKTWFITITKVKKDLISNNEKINWHPAYLKKGRFGNWLKEVRDWAIARDRYWGTPLPVWECKNCKHTEMIGGVNDIVKQKFDTNRYFLLRHGQSLRQTKEKNLSMCWPEKIHCPLTDKGKEEALKTAKQLAKDGIDLIFSSDLLRTKQTAEIVGQELKIPVKFSKKIREFDVGTFNGKEARLSWEYRKEKGDLIGTRLPGGESYIDVRKRVYKFIKEINNKYKDKNILIISHESPLTVLEKTLKGWPLEKIVDWRWKKRKDLIKTGQWREVKFADLPYNKKMQLDLHRPFIDKIKFHCSGCNTLMERVPEVIDCWFDSGAMPFAQYHYPFENKSLIDDNKQFPADYICEAIDQTRGWFYTLLAISTLLGKGPAYKNVISLGHLLDEKGEKMSKSKGNIIDPWYIFEKYSADAVRWSFYTINQPGDPKLFSEKDPEKSLRKFILPLWNSYVFLKTYSNSQFFTTKKPVSNNILDKWIISKLDELILNATKSLENYDITSASRNIEKFLMSEVSLWYIRRSRKRFQQPESNLELKQASQTLSFVIFQILKLSSPFIPFLAEHIYQDFKKSGLKAKLSVHLEDWPQSVEKSVDKILNVKMDKVREIVVQGLAERAKAKIKVRQALQELTIKDKELKNESQLLDLIKQEVNIKEISFGKEIKLNTELTKALKEEGLVREVIRQIQEIRKEKKLIPQDAILVQFEGEHDISELLLRKEKEIVKETKAKDLDLVKGLKKGKQINVNGQKLQLSIKKVK